MFITENSFSPNLYIFLSLGKDFDFNHFFSILVKLIKYTDCLIFIGQMFVNSSAFSLWVVKHQNEFHWEEKDQIMKQKKVSICFFGTVGSLVYNLSCIMI